MGIENNFPNRSLGGNHGCGSCPNNAVYHETCSPPTNEAYERISQRDHVKSLEEKQRRLQESQPPKDIS